MNAVSQTQIKELAIMEPELRCAIDRAAAILKAAGAEAVYLFGSSVAGSFRPGSDLDFAVSGLPSARFYQIMGQLLLVLPHPIDLVDLDIDNPFTRYLKQKGRLHRVA